MTETAALTPWNAPMPPAESASGKPFHSMWQDGETPSFEDLLDVINPLHHIPIVSTIYRAVTGDEISLGSRLAGGALFGGALGVIFTGITAAIEEASGGEISEHLAALFNGEEPTHQLATAAEAPSFERKHSSLQSLAPSIPPQFAAQFEMAVAASPARPVAPYGSPDRRPSLADEAQDPADRRLVRAQLEEQRAQAQLLLSRLATQAQTASPRPDAADRRETRDEARRSPHPLTPPPNATPDWYLKAMERVYRKYQGSTRARTDRDDAPPASTRAFSVPGGTI